jgi:hypothetical protein
MVQFGEADLRLDIGASLDLLEPLARDTSGEWLTVGADFMTYTRLRSEGNFKFPVETVDYWFGLNTKWQVPSSPLHARLRIAHISSHLVDGLADSTATISPKPFVYSREFAEVLIGWHLGSLRPYAGFTAMWASQPKTPERFWPQAGIDAVIDLGSAWSVRAGYDWKLIGIDGAWAPQHAAQAGLAYTPWKGRGLALNLYGYDGRSMHGMFYTSFDSYIGLGLQILY